MKIDLHNHTVHSPDSSTTVGDCISSAIRAGMEGIAVTDHNTVRGSLEAEKLAEGRLVILTGAEVSTLDGHLLCLGIREEIPKGRPMAETIDTVLSLGGLAIPSHPFRIGTGAGRHVLDSLNPAAVECVNGRNMNSRNRKAIEYARSRGIGCTGGSDSHSPGEVGRAYTVIEGSGLTAAEVLEVLAKGESSAAGKGQGLGGSARTLFKIVTEYFQRGRRHI